MPNHYINPANGKSLDIIQVRKMFTIIKALDDANYLYDVLSKTCDKNSEVMRKINSVCGHLERSLSKLGVEV